MVILERKRKCCWRHFMTKVLCFDRLFLWPISVYHLGIFGQNTTILIYNQFIDDLLLPDLYHHQPFSPARDIFDACRRLNGNLFQLVLMMVKQARSISFHRFFSKTNCRTIVWSQPTPGY